MFRLLNKGYTLIEVLIVLVILGLVSALVAPNMASWISSRERASDLKALKATLELMPLQATTRKDGIRLAEGSTIEDLDGFEVIQEIVVLPNGYCLGGQVRYTKTDPPIDILVTEPLCGVDNN